MKHLPLVLAGALALGFSALVADGQGPADRPAQVQMPSREYVLEIGGQEFDVAVDQPRNLRVGDQTHRVTLKVKPFIRFNFRGISFDFPQHFAYSLNDTDPLFSQWDLSGTQASIMLQCFEDGTSIDLIRAVLVPGVKAQFQGMRVGEEQVGFRAENGQSFDGTRLTISMPDVTIVQDVYLFEHRKKVYALWLQDVPAAGRPTDEFQAMLEKLKQTLVIEK